MDTTAVLDKYTHDLSNLPLEVKHLLQEVKNKDIQLHDARKRYQTKDNQLHKFIRANGTLTKHPKEQQLYSKIEEDMALVRKLQKEKILLSNTAFFLVSKHLFNLETDIAKLERDELLPPVESVLEVDTPAGMHRAISAVSDSVSGGSTPRPGAPSATPGTEGASQTTKRGGAAQKRKHGTVKGANGSNRPNKRIKAEELEARKLEEAYARAGAGMGTGAGAGASASSAGNSRGSTPIGGAGASSLSALGGGAGAGAFGGPGGGMGSDSDPATASQLALSGPLDASGATAGGLQLGHTATITGEDADNNLYCFCQRVSFGEMIGCDNDDCKYEWFHWSCVGITAPPKDDDIWYCPDCAPKMEKRKKKRK